MNILKKRAIAILIDSFLLGLAFVFYQKIINLLGLNLGNLDLLLFIPFFLKDIVFRNASVGKKVVGIAIYNDNWQSPSIIVLFKRAIIMSTIGYFIFWKSKFVNGDIISFFDFERDTLKTRVIDKKVLKKIRAEAEAEAGDKSVNMTRLYNEYLKDIYMK